MAFLYYLYQTDQGNTVISASTTPFTTGPNQGQLFTSYAIPQIQPLFLYAVNTGGTAIITNTDHQINSYLKSINQGSSLTTDYIFTGYTASTSSQIFYISGQTAMKLNTSRFLSYTGTTAPATYATKVNFNTYTGTTAPNTYLSKTAFNAYSASTTANGVSHALFNTYTGTTAPATYVFKTPFSTYTGTTAPNQFQSHSSIVTLTGTTLPATYVFKAPFATYTGTTAPATYALKTLFNTYTGTTAPNSFQSHSSIVTLTGTTLPATYVFKAPFATYTGTTAPNQFQSHSSIVTLTGTTLPATYLSISNFNTYSGLTLTNINSRLLTSAFNTYSGLTLTNINSRLLTSAFNTYSGATQTSINSKLSTTAFNAYSAATATQIQLAQYGLDFKQSVFVATTANITLSGLQTIDGVSVTAGKRVLVKNQTTGSTNGIYVAAAGAWSRSADANGTAAGPVTSGLYTFVETGATNSDSAWALTTQDPITVGTTSLTFTKVTTLSDLTPGNGISKSSNTISVKTSDIAGSGLLSTPTQLFVNVTGGTVFTTFTPRTIFNTFTGTTAPATYLKITNFNTYSGATQTTINSKLNSSLFNTYTGTTAPATYVFKAPFATYTGTTAPATYALKTNFNTYTGTTAPATYALKTNFNTYTGTTAPATYALKSLFNAFTGTTINTANNGLTKSGQNVKLGGTLTGATTIDASTFNFVLTGTTGQLNLYRTTGAINIRNRGNINLFGTSNAGVDRTQLKISATGATFFDSRTGTTAAGLQYAADYSANYNARSVIDYNAFTANTLYTKVQLLVYASGTTDLNVTTAVSIPLNRLIRNNSTYFTYTGGTTIKILIGGVYDVSYAINGTNSNGTAHSIAANIYKNGTSITETTSAAGTVGTTSAGAQLILPMTQLTFAANDLITLRGYRLISGGGSFNTTANTVFLSIVKKY